MSEMEKIVGKWRQHSDLARSKRLNKTLHNQFTNLSSQDCQASLGT